MIEAPALDPPASPATIPSKISNQGLSLVLCSSSVPVVHRTPPKKGRLAALPTASQGPKETQKTVSKSPLFGLWTDATGHPAIRLSTTATGDKIAHLPYSLVPGPVPDGAHRTAFAPLAGLSILSPLPCAVARSSHLIFSLAQLFSLSLPLSTHRLEHQTSCNPTLLFLHRPKTLFGTTSA